LAQARTCGTPPEAPHTVNRRDEDGNPLIARCERLLRACLKLNG
jgi:hypothetical protein